MACNIQIVCTPLQQHHHSPPHSSSSPDSFLAHTVPTTAERWPTGWEQPKLSSKCQRIRPTPNSPRVQKTLQQTANPQNSSKPNTNFNPKPLQKLPQNPNKPLNPRPTLPTQNTTLPKFPKPAKPQRAKTLTHITYIFHQLSWILYNATTCSFPICDEESLTP
jgi:hypothetical protein